MVGIAFIFIIAAYGLNTLVSCILGGHEIPIQQAPHQVNYGDICGGVLFDASWVLTAAHCGIHTFVRVGSKHRKAGMRIPINRHRLHPNYRENHEFGYDLQLLRLYRPSKIKNLLNFSLSNGAKIINITGWGYLKEKTEFSDLLNQVQLNIVSKAECQTVNESRYNNSLTDEMFCAGGKGGDACQGDSGGAAVTSSGIIGISSFGYGCGRVPGVYINVTHPGIMEWIRDFTGLTLKLS